MHDRAILALMPYFLVRRARGPAWDFTVGRREQVGWDEHAAFMDGLVDDGVVILGGPVGEGDGEDALLVVAAENEAATRARLADDPWEETLLTTKSVELWSIGLRGRKGVWPSGQTPVQPVSDQKV